MITIEPIPSKHQAAKALVQHAKSKVRQLGYDERDGDEIWCVFDRDDNTDNDLRSAEALAKASKYNIAYSNPSFELWYLLHFVDQRGEIANGDAVVRMLNISGRLLGCDKSKSYHELLTPNRDKTIERATRRLEELKLEVQELHRRGGNPYTTVGQLVRYLLERSNGS